MSKLTDILFCVGIFVLSTTKNSTIMKSFRTMVAESTERLMRYAMTLCGNRMDAEDLTQETILRMLTREDQFEMGTNFEGWSIVVMKSTFLRIEKAEKLRRTDDIDTCYRVMSDNSTDSGFDMKSYFDILPEPQRKCIKMITDGYKYQEIADIMNIPIGTVKSRINHARSKIVSVFGSINL